MLCRAFLLSTSLGSSTAQASLCILKELPNSKFIFYTQTSLIALYTITLLRCLGRPRRLTISSPFTFLTRFWPTNIFNSFATCANYLSLLDALLSPYPPALQTSRPRLLRRLFLCNSGPPVTPKLPALSFSYRSPIRLASLSPKVLLFRSGRYTSLYRWLLINSR